MGNLEDNNIKFKRNRESTFPDNNLFENLNEIKYLNFTRVTILSVLKMKIETCSLC